MAKYKNSSIKVVVLGTAKPFIDSLSHEEKETAFAMIRKLEEKPHSPKFVELVDKKTRVFEARGTTKDVWIRLFWFYSKLPKGVSEIIITNGYLKKQNKTDSKEIKKANKIKKTYSA